MAKESNQQQEREQREKKRGVALENLKSSLVDLASAYFVNKSGQYGEAGDSAVEQFIYFPALKSEKGNEILLNSLLGSREDGKRYTGNVSEYKIIKTAADIFQESLGSVTVSDVLGLMGSGANVKRGYEGSYIADLAKSENEDDKKFLGDLIDGYQMYITDKKVAEALEKRAEAVKGGLEELVKEPEKPKSQKSK